uniref:Uncharacterized protein n=1 Tax=Oryza glumipatula TaxID=40148 RepID=A0A0D9Z066_9ORYZ
MKWTIATGLRKNQLQQGKNISTPEPFLQFRGTVTQSVTYVGWAKRWEEKNKICINKKHVR